MGLKGTWETGRWTIPFYTSPISPLPSEHWGLQLNCATINVAQINTTDHNFKLIFVILFAVHHCLCQCSLRSYCHYHYDYVHINVNSLTIVSLLQQSIFQYQQHKTIIFSQTGFYLKTQSSISPGSNTELWSQMGGNWWIIENSSMRKFWLQRSWTYATFCCK